MTIKHPDHLFKTLMERSLLKPKETQRQLNKAEVKHPKTLIKQLVEIKWTS